VKLFGLKRVWCRRAVCLNECPRNLILASKVDVLEYIEAAERGEGAPPLSNIAVRVKKAVHTIERKLGPPKLFRHKIVPINFVPRSA